MPRRPAAIQEARPTVRLKNEDGTYKETQEVIDFEASGGSLSDLLDDEKYICSNRRRKTKYSWSAFSSPGTGFTINSTILKDSFLWNPGPPNARPPTVPFSSRTPTRLQKVFNLVARACKIEGGEIGDITREFRDDLGMSSSDTTVESDIKGLYVGISASECLPVVLFKGASKNTVGRDDFSLGVDWDGNLGDREIIWLQNMLIPGNIQYLKSAIDNKITDQEKKQFLQIMKRENRLLETGLNPAGVADTPFQRVRTLSRDWDALTVYLENDEPTTQEARRLLSKVHPFVASVEVVSTNASDGIGSLEDVLRLAYGAAGLDPQSALIRHEKNWASQKTVFYQFGPSVEQAIKDITVLKPLEDGFRFALPSIGILMRSALIQDQIRIYKDIKALLDEEA
ncbi:hypothetical protein FPSE5266_03455 [Fusarium pseudograminearum]|nr:hypothetical protein FPSE5266_03455 [Fusarium pseudograminearum]